MTLKTPHPIMSSELALVEAHLYEYIGREEGVLGEVLAQVMQSRGKMLRPMLLLLAGRLGLGGRTAPKGYQDRLCRLGALLELVHLASLIHDDIIDDSPLRRGKATLQYAFGKDVAVYTGDFLLARIVYHLLNENFQISGVFLAEAVQAMCRGEIAQYRLRHNPDTTTQSYIQNIRDKTASMFIAACRIAAHESGCATQLSSSLEAIGHHMGCAFQLRDDILDFTSSPTQEGKPTHADFRDGIFTLPVLHTLGSPRYGLELRGLIHSSYKTYSNEDIAKMQEFVELSGGIDYTKTQISAHTQAIRTFLQIFPDTEEKEALFDITFWLEA